ncbi:hypothetical protein CHH28_13335 [Bacterioplanes sanyensis]|uniref:Replication protein n=1 Tax=Bacterioplanes sanyensis TaxID=1249553 RepID=A0A222FMZ4_9GAMM|nr:hypothetical protein [Bacterioplanes sanyensis]ASP39593.1 hypothetical protein CHH28_13335 [Bacterioplanes sanyensis]
MNPNYHNKTKRNQLKQANKELIKNYIEQNQCNIFMTITVIEPNMEKKWKYNDWRISNNRLIRDLNLLFCWINSHLYGRRYKKHNKFLEGIGAIEYQANGQPHIHLVIANEITKQELDEAIERRVQKLKIFSPKGIDVQEIEQSESSHTRLSQYLVKDTNKLPNHETPHLQMSGNTVFLGINGFY